MSRYRFYPSLAQEVVLRVHCAHARYVWNLAVEQQSWWRPGHARTPGYVEQCRQLTAARAEHFWLRVGSQMVQQQALRDFAQAMANFFAGTHRKPTWRKAGRNEGFRIVAVGPGHVQRLSRKTGQVWVPKAAWVRRFDVIRDEDRKICNADLNAARNIAAGRAVTAPGRSGLPGRVNREPQLALLPA